MHTFLLQARRDFALGDVVLVTALTRDVQRAYPGQYRLLVDSNWAPVWQNNPHVIRPADYRQEHQLVRLSYTEGIVASKQGVRKHYLGQFHRDFARKTGLTVPVSLPHGDLHLDAQEKQPWVRGRYWVLMAGGKLDLTTKHWNFARYQQLVDALRPDGIRFIQCGATHRLHVHPPLDGVLNAVGRTNNVRDLFGLIANADGVVCGITGAMHIAAALGRPCVVIAGGREEPWWEHYGEDPAVFGPDCPPSAMPHRFLHTLGRLPCCQTRGCWKSRTAPLEDKDRRPGARHLCVDPVTSPETGLLVPHCMELITVDEVAAAVRHYYRAGLLPPPPEQPDLAWLRPPTEPLQTQGLEQRTPPAAQLITAPVPAALSHPLLGGRLTVFVLCYGNHAALARRCLDSIRRTTPPGSIDLRVACNACSAETLQYLRDQPLTRLYVHQQNRYKYPVMRELFHDPEQPITTPYLVWFDDDSFVVDPLWLEKLADCVVANHPHGCRLYGAEFLHDFNVYRTAGHDPGRWFREAPWYRGRDFFAGRQARFTAPNGTVLRFVAGGFWALATEAMRACDIPDRRLLMNLGDACVGSQLQQGGFKTCSFNRNKSLIHTSAAPPRGASQTGSAKRAPWQAGGEGRPTQVPSAV